MGIFGSRKKIPDDMNGINVPEHIAIIMDGNGRWAKKHKVPRSLGHKAGAETLKKVCRHASKRGIKYITVYAFSTENWKREVEEVSAIMSLLLHYLKNAEEELGADKARIRIIGDKTPFSDEIKSEMERVERVTENNKDYNLTIALNYGGRDEICRAARSLAKKAANGEINPDDITEDMISSSLDTSVITDPDLIIRTSGEIRTSNYLLWQSAYSEYYFTNVLWPDFDGDELDKAILEFSRRKRRFGGR